MGRSTSSSSSSPPSPFPFALADVPGLERYERTTRRVIVLTAAALVLRLAFLQSRIAHYDEGRVAWWAHYFMETGSFHYQPIIHGPLVQHVDAFLFLVFGANDFTMRLFVALVGGLLPLSALLYRHRLRSSEVLGVAFFLAFNPILLYYSRFFRSTVPVAAFSFVTFGFLLRVYDEGSIRSLYGAAFFFALAFASKENALVYVACWLGALGLLAEHALFRSSEDRSGVDWLIERVRADDGPVSRFLAAPWYYLGHVAIALALFCLVTLYLYAPRTPHTGAIGFWEAVGNPLKMPELIGETYNDIKTGFENWVGKSEHVGNRWDSKWDQYTSYFDMAYKALKNYAVPLMVLSVFGFLLERYGSDRTSYLVMFASYWGFVSIVGYPYGTDIGNAWITVNAIVPLTIPAGVGLAYVAREARDALGPDPVRFGFAVFALALVVVMMVVTGVNGVYLNPTSDDNELVQYAQPADDFRPAMRFVDNRPAHNSTDVLFVGTSYVRNEPRDGGLRPLCLSIGDGLPMHWYAEIYDAEATCEQRPVDVIRNMSRYDPLVVVAPSQTADRLSRSPQFDGYETQRHRLRVYGSELVFFVDRNRSG